MSKINKDPALWFFVLEMPTPCFFPRAIVAFFLRCVSVCVCVSVFVCIVDVMKIITFLVRGL